MSVHVYFDKQVHKKWKKKMEKKIKSLNFAESNAHRKTNARGSFETYNIIAKSCATHRQLGIGSQGLPVSSKAEKTWFFSTVFFLPGRNSFFRSNSEETQK